MTPETAARTVRTALLLSGAVAMSTGAAVALRGTAAIPGGAPTGASNDSVLRFYAVWWAGQGTAMVRLALDPDLDERAVREVCATTLLGGLARLTAARTSGRPHPLFQALTAGELLLPPALLALRSQAYGAGDDRLAGVSAPAGSSRRRRAGAAGGPATGRRSAGTAAPAR